MKLTADDLAQELDHIAELARQRMDDGVGHHGEQWRIGGRTAINFMVEKIRSLATRSPKPAKPAVHDTLGAGKMWNWVEGVTHGEESASYLRDRCKHSIRVREGGGPENLPSSLIATFMGMEQKLAIKAEPAVESTGTIGTVTAVGPYSCSGRAVEILVNPFTPRWEVGQNARVTISPTGGKSDEAAATPT